MCAGTSETFEILITAGATSNAASEALRVKLRDQERDKDLFNVAMRGNLDKLKELIAGGADPNGFKNQFGVRVIAETGRAPPHPLCGRVLPRVSRSGVGPRRLVNVRACLVLRFVESSRPNRPPPPSSSSELAVAAARIVMTGHAHSDGRATAPIPTPGSKWSWDGRPREMARTAAG